MYAFKDSNVTATNDFIPYLEYNQMNASLATKQASLVWKARNNILRKSHGAR